MFVHFNLFQVVLTSILNTVMSKNSSSFGIRMFMMPKLEQHISTTHTTIN